MTDSAQQKARLQAYFDGVGFDRWAAIYGQTPLSAVRRTIRDGHAAMLGLAEQWLRERGLSASAHILDAGCGTGLFSLALARCGFCVTAVDIAPQMIAAARQAAEAAGLQGRIRFVAGDLEQVRSCFDAVACFDVLVHYARPAFDDLCAHLAAHCSGPLYLTYAPYNRLLAALHWLGGHFPHNQRRSEIQMLPDHEVQSILARLGYRIARRQRIGVGFYHVTLLEAVRDNRLTGAMQR